MRLRLAFKFNGQEADLARYIADASGVTTDDIAKLAMKRYMREVISRAEEMQKQLANQQEVTTEGEDNARLQSSQPDAVFPDGTLPPPPDAIPSPASGQS